jgi:hypothetical protein
MMERSNDCIRRLVAFGSALLLTLASIAGAQSDTKFESPPTLRAHDLASASLLNGSGFHVEDNVPTDGLTAKLATNAVRPVAAAGQ